MTRTWSASGRAMTPLQYLAALDVRLVVGDPLLARTLREAAIDRAAAIVTARTTFENLNVALAARSCGPSPGRHPHVQRRARLAHPRAVPRRRRALILGPRRARGSLAPPSTAKAAAASSWRVGCCRRGASATPPMALVRCRWHASTLTGRGGPAAGCCPGDPDLLLVDIATPRGSRRPSRMTCRRERAPPRPASTERPASWPASAVARAGAAALALGHGPGAPRGQIRLYFKVAGRPVAARRDS